MDHIEAIHYFNLFFVFYNKIFWTELVMASCLKLYLKKMKQYKYLLKEKNK